MVKETLLKAHFLRGRVLGDILHINSMGHSLLVKLMKEAIYLRRKGIVDGRSYSSRVKSGGESGNT